MLNLAFHNLVVLALVGDCYTAFTVIIVVSNKIEDSIMVSNKIEDFIIVVIVVNNKIGDSISSTYIN